MTALDMRLGRDKSRLHAEAERSCPHLTVEDGKLFWRGVYMPRSEAFRVAESFAVSDWNDPPFRQWANEIRAALKETAQ